MTAVVLIMFPIMIGILFFLFEFYDDELLAFLVLTLVWLCAVYNDQDGDDGAGRGWCVGSEVTRSGRPLDGMVQGGRSAVQGGDRAAGRCVAGGDARQGVVGAAGEGIQVRSVSAWQRLESSGLLARGSD